MGKYTEDAKELLQYVGGKENVGAVAHCMTRACASCSMTPRRRISARLKA